MGYGGGIALLALGLILALAVSDRVEGVDLTMIGWILAGAGALLLVIAAVQNNSRRTSRAVRSTTHADGSQTIQEARRDSDPPPVV